jgi:hypothetical protein
LAGTIYGAEFFCIIFVNIVNILHFLSLRKYLPYKGL